VFGQLLLQENVALTCCVCVDMITAQCYWSHSVHSSELNRLSASISISPYIIRCQKN